MNGGIIYLTGDWSQPSETFIRGEVARLKARAISIVTASVYASEPVVDGVYSLSPHPAPVSAYPSIRSKVPFRVRAALGPIRHRKLIHQLMLLARERQATHLHAAFGGLPALVCAVAAKRLNLPYSVSLHANDLLKPLYPDRMVLSGTDTIFCCNRHAMDHLLERSPQLANNVVLAPHGIDLSTWPFSPKPSLNIPLNVMFVGRLVKKKDPLRAERLVNSLVEDGMDAQLTVIGDGPVRPRTVEPLGFLAHDLVRQRLSQSDLLICTSRDLEDGDAEGVPNVILEAMALGIPVVSTTAGSIGEVVRDDTAYRLTSDAAFPALIRSVVENDAERLDRVRKARKLVENEWNADILIETKAAYFRER